MDVRTPSLPSRCRFWTVFWAARRRKEPDRLWLLRPWRWRKPHSMALGLGSLRELPMHRWPVKTMLNHPFPAIRLLRGSPSYPPRNQNTARWPFGAGFIVRTQSEEITARAKWESTPYPTNPRGAG